MDIAQAAIVFRGVVPGTEDKFRISGAEHDGALSCFEFLYAAVEGADFRGADE